MSDVIVPKTYVRDLKAPLIFLAGPIRGASNWQDKAIGFLFSKEPNLVIATPRMGVRDNIAPHIITGDENHFPRGRAWERYYIDIASKNGGVMFWLPEKTEEIGEKPYASMTRIELGEAIGRYREDNSIRFCVGSGGNFQDLDAIQDDLKAYAPRPIYSTLKETCNEVLRLAQLK